MSIKDNGYNNITDNTKSDNRNTNSNTKRAINQICLAAYGHPQQCACQLLKLINKDLIGFIDGEKNCAGCKRISKRSYNEILNRGELSTSLLHYTDITDGINLFNIYTNADCCKHVNDPELLKKDFEEVLNDFEASVNNKKYGIEFTTKEMAIQNLHSRDYKIVDYEETEELDDLGSSTKYIIYLPEGRVSTTEDEAKAICALSKRPIITNMAKRFFLVLRDD